ncbi:MAG: dockerin type I repeat-containing protein, partial [Ruminococcus sp.]|nr:dockerin type I repeat-containing protein [Ruminococcus sp.]
ITISDLIILQKFILGIQKITKEQAKLADLTQDNIVNVLDLTILKHRLLSYNMYI